MFLLNLNFRLFEKIKYSVNEGKLQTLLCYIMNYPDSNLYVKGVKFEVQSAATK